ncbi:MAG: glycosyltransferase family 39 protein [Candidatus Omnitrophota bacterium]|jgi:4-amino-4-deoxy-L-arabinose transferase-like glycosyltransferase
MVKIKKKHILLITILSVGFILRIWGIGFGLPYQFHQDEPMAINHAIAYGSGDFNPHYFQLPPLLSYLLFFLYAIFYGIGKLLHLFKDGDSFLRLFLQNPTIFYLIARISFGLLPGCISIFLTYKLTQVISNKKTAYLAALLLSVSFLHVRDSHYAYHDIPLVMCLLLAFLFSFKYLNTNKLSNMIAAGICAGLATGFKYNGVLIIIPILLQPWLIKNDKKISITGVLQVNLVFFILFILSYILSNPYSVLDIKTFLASVFIEKQVHAYVGWLHHITYSAFAGMGLLITIISVAGLIMFMFSKDIRKKLIALFVLLSYLSIALFGQVHERYILPILPFLLIIAAVYIGDVSGKLPVKKQKLFFIFVIPLIAISPFLKSLYSDILFSRKDTRAQATDWIIANMPAATSIALDHSFFSPRLFQSPEQFDEKINLLENKKEFGGRLKKAKILKEISEQEKSYQVFFLNNIQEDKFIFSTSPKLPFSVTEILKNNLAYVVLHLDYPEQEYPNAGFRKGLLSRAKLIKVFNPYKKDNINLKGEFSTTAAAFSSKEISSRITNGPVLFIYKLD